MSTVLLSLCLFHDKHIEYITLNLYKHPAYKSPKDWIKRKSLHFEEKIALTQCFEINDKACRLGEFTLATFKQDTKKLPVGSVAKGSTSAGRLGSTPD